MKKEQKFLTEIGLIQATDGVAILKPADLYRTGDMLKEQLDKLEDYHIYFVCQRPRVRITASIKNSKSELEITLTVSGHFSDTQKTVITSPIPLESPIEKLVPENNGATFRFGMNGGIETGEYPIELLLTLLPKGISELTDLEVVYIGQAVGSSKTTRSAIDRLLSHSTLQRVLAEQAQTAWWMESVLILFSYPENPLLITKTDGRNSPTITGDADWSHFSTIRENPLSSDQLITIAEASLIRYFQPKYNKHYTGEYPTSNRKHLKDAYRLDYNAIVTEIDTEEIGVTIRSPSINSDIHHIVQFDLHDPNTRLSFFEFDGVRLDKDPTL